MARIVKAPDDRRSELITTAQQLFYTKGYENTSVSDIVKAVGVAQGTFYYYFDSKQEVLEALVSELAAQYIKYFEIILTNDALSAMQKWARAIQVIGDWKIERKDELLALSRMMRADENVLLYHKLQTQRTQVMVGIFTSIIAQGIEEGVFETPCVEEASEMVWAVLQNTSAVLTDIILNPENYDQPEALARRKVAALKITIERILGAAPGSLPFIDEQVLAPWFEN